MKCVLILALLSLECGSAKAAGPAVSCESNNPQMPCPSTAVPSPSPTEKIDTWTATKFNEDLLKDPALTDPSAAKADVSQADTYILHSNVLYGCVEKSLGGRNDDLCQADPGNPECVGLNKALENATNCKEYFVPATLGCKVYGTSDYSMEEWIAVGDQFSKTIGDCSAQKDSTPDPKLMNLTQMLNSNPIASALPAAPSLAGASLAPASAVSGEAPKAAQVGALDWEELSSRLQDGASHLGYENGDILKAFGKGESFSSIVLASPFVEKLNEPNREKVEEGLADSAMIAKRMVQTRQEGRQENEAGDEPPVSAVVDSGSQAEQPALLAPVADSGSEVSVGAGASASSLVPPPGFAPAIALVEAENLTPPSRPAPPPKKMTEAERIEALAAAVDLARKEHRPFRAPASANTSTSASAMKEEKAASTEDLTLFQRVSLAYRRQSPAMRRRASAAPGESLRAMERPEIFRDL